MLSPCHAYDSGRHVAEENSITLYNFTGTSTLYLMDVQSTTKKRSFIVVGDNWDKTINPRFMTMEHQRQSLHYFHAYAAQDRIDFSSLSTDTPLVNCHYRRIYLMQLIA